MVWKERLSGIFRHFAKGPDPGWSDLMGNCIMEPAASTWGEVQNGKERSLKVSSSILQFFKGLQSCQSSGNSYKLFAILY